MSSATSKLTRKLQAMIPASIRKHLGLRPGDTITFELRNGEVLVRRAGASDMAFAAALSATLAEWEPENDEVAYRNL